MGDFVAGFGAGVLVTLWVFAASLWVRKGVER